MLCLDFESRSTCDIWSAGAYVYAADPSTEVLCLAYAVDDGAVKLWLPGMPVPQEFFDAIAFGDFFEAHNVFFERCIWKHIMVPKFKFPEVPECLWRCTMARCSAMGMPRALDKAAEALQISEQKDKQGAVVMRRIAKSCAVPYDELVKTYDEDLKRLYEYCMQDVRTERGISKKLPELSEFELGVWQLDQRINMRGVQVDTDAVNKALPLLADYTAELNKELFSLTQGEVSSATQRDGMLRWIRKNGLPVADKLTKLQVQEWLKLPDLPQDVRDVLLVRSEIGKTSVAKYEVFQAATSSDGRLRDILVYCGAGATGRWSGKLVQLQNLPADRTGKFDIPEACEILKTSPESFRLFYPDLAAALSFCLRGMVIAKPKHDLIVADYATIEVRVLAWLASESRLLEAFSAGRDVYIEMAKAIFEKNITKDNKAERQLGKQAVLGCIAEGSMVYSDTGFTPIETIKQGQKLWDGEKWVNFRALVPTGKKNVIQIDGLWLTPDHRLLTRHGWQTAGEIALSGDTSVLRLGKYSEDGLLLAENITSVQNVVSLSVANAELKKIEGLTNFGEVLQNCVLDVTTPLPDVKVDVRVNMLTSYLMHAYANVGVPVGEIFNTAVRTKIAKTSSGMVLEGFRYPSNHVERSWNTLLRLLGGTSGDSPLIELKMPRGTQEEICALLHSARTITIKTAECYDILDADTSRFQVGGLIAHNCGYGMGKVKFEATCKTYGIAVNAQLADKAVSTYRSTFKAIPAFWREMDAMFRATLNAKNGTVNWTRDKKIGMGMYRDWLLIRLPSGRCLAYYKPSINSEDEIVYKTVNSVTRQWETTKTYGGKIVENITQATARDLMAAAMIRSEASGYPIVLTVHDELVVEVPEGFGSVPDFEKLICASPTWAKGCPIKAEGWRGKRYKK